MSGRQEELSADTAIDPYTIRPGDERDAPPNFWGRFKHLGPSMIVTGSIVGSGEIILTAGLGAAAGFTLLWWVLLSCWSKSIVQAEMARYVVLTGDTYLRAINRVPGRIRGPRGPVAWPIWLGMIGFIPGITGLGGILGGAGQALALITPDIIDGVGGTAIVAVLSAIILSIGAYRGLERMMLVLVISFTLTTLICAIAMQFTEFGMTGEDLAAGFAFDFPMEYLVLALAVYGYTGVNSGETAAYTYWCVEKGYPSYIGANREDPAWEARARGWLKVLHTDVWVTLAILTCATLPFYVLGAGVLNALGVQPEGTETISALSNMFTATLGEWAFWLFGFGAFFILFSTVLSGIGAGGRVLPDYFAVLGFLDRLNLPGRIRFTRGYVVVIPIIGFLLYVAFQNPVTLIIVGAITAAVFAPIQSGATIWLQKNHMDQRLLPGIAARSLLWSVFIFQLGMAWLVLRYVVF